MASCLPMEFFGGCLLLVAILRLLITWPVIRPSEIPTAAFEAAFTEQQTASSLTA